MVEEGGGPVMILPGGVYHRPPDFEVTLLEPRPFRPFKSSEEYLYAMKEDLAEWLNGLYEGLDLDADNFLEQMETGVVLCQHANNVVRKAREYYRSGNALHHGDVPVPDRDVVYRRDVLPETFHARDNVSNFISWCRALSIKECLLFETDDLVLRKNERSFILCLLEVARRGVKFGMPAPLLVQLEQEIDAEIANDDDGYETMNVRQPQVVTNDLRSLHERVVELLSRCTCPSQFPMIRVADGKYRIGDTKVLIFVRILRSHVMVRVGGGWDTLAHYLDKHDPCRCRSGHRLATSAKLTMLQNKSAIPSMHVTYNRPPQNPTSTPSSPQSVRRSLPYTSPVPHRRSSQQQSSPPTSMKSQQPPCSDDSSNSSLQDTLERKPKPRQLVRRKSQGRNSSSDDEEGSAEEVATFSRTTRGRTSGRDLVLRDTVSSSWKYSPGAHQSEPAAVGGQHQRRASESSSRLPSLTPRSEKRPPPKVGKVAPRVQHPAQPQPWTDHRSQSSENLYHYAHPGSAPTRTVVFHSRGPSPISARSRQMAEKYVLENGFRRNDPKRHSSPRIHPPDGQQPPRTRLSPPRFVSKPRVLPIHQPPIPSRTPVQQNGAGRRMFWSPERQPPRSLVSRKNSAPSLDSAQLPVIEKLQQYADLCSDQEFLDKIEQLIEEFQAKTKMTSGDDRHPNGRGMTYASLPATMRNGSSGDSPPATLRNGSGDSPPSTLRNGSGDDSPPTTLRNGSEPLPASPMKDGYESECVSLKNGRIHEQPSPTVLRDGSSICESLPPTLRNGSGSEQPLPATLRNGSSNCESLPTTLKNGSSNGELKTGQRRSPVESGLGKSPSRIPLPVWYPKCQS